MINKKVEKFLENNNINYLFLLLANEEVHRLNNLPEMAKNKILTKKITETALEHIAENRIDDYAEYFEFEEEDIEA